MITRKFKERLEIGKAGEAEAIRFLKNKYNEITIEQQNEHNQAYMKHDITTDAGRKFEIKKDLRFIDTNNLFIETNNKLGNKSGLYISTADIWLFILNEHIYTIGINELKSIISKNNLKFVNHTTRNGGGYILPFYKYIKFFNFEGLLSQYQ